MQIKFKNNVDIKYSDYITITQIFHSIMEQNQQNFILSNNIFNV